MRKLPFILPFYHAVSNEVLPHLKYLFHVKSVTEFTKDVDHMCKHYSFVDLKEFYEHAKNGFKNQRRPIAHLTFDDGLRECYDVIVPILRAKGLPATFFINTAFVDNKSLFFRFKASLINERLRAKGRHDQNRIEEVMSIRYDERERLDVIGNELGIDFDNFLRKQQPYMSSDQVSSILDTGFSIGSHSVDHPEFRFVSEDLALKQVETSIRELHEEYDLKIKAFSFPFTDHELKSSFFEKLHENKILDISFGTAGIKFDQAPMNFQRVPMEFNYSAGSIVGYYQMKSVIRHLVGKNVIKR